MRQFGFVLGAVCAAWIAFNSCNNKRDGYLLDSPFLPIQLVSDSTEVILDDFLGGNVKIDTVFYEGHKQSPVSSTHSQNGRINLNKQPQNGLGILTIWSNDDHWEIQVLHSETEKVIYRLEGEQQAQSIFL